MNRIRKSKKEKGSITVKQLLIIILSIIVVGVSLAIIIPNISKGSSGGSQNPTVTPVKPIENKEDKLLLGDDYKTSYFVDDKFEKPNVYILYVNGDLEDLSKSKNVTFSGYDLSTAGEYTVIVTYKYNKKELTTEYNITVYNSEVIDLTVTCEQKELVWGKTIDKSKVVVTAYYNDNRNEVVQDYQLKYNNKPDEYGEVTVTVVYRGFSVEFTINVVGKTVEERYKLLEDEAILLLGRFGLYDPSIPMNYDFDIDSSSTPLIKFSGVLDSSLTTFELQSAFLLTNIFYDYEFVSGPENSIDLIFPSQKVVFNNSERDVTASIYIVALFGEIKYTVVIKELL